ncbi:MAG: DUF3105 domain-containing protein [Actinomycetota bacterium]
MAPAKKRPAQGKNKPKSNDKGSDASPAKEEPGNAASSGSRNAEERKAKREASRQERLEAARKKQKAKRRKQMLIAGGLAVVLLAVISFVIKSNADEQQEFLAAAEAADCTEIVEHENEGRDHLGQGQTYDDYQTNPPTSGPHNPQPAPWGSYRETVDPESLVHSLEHGGIVVHYKDLGNSEVDALENLVDSYRNGVISNPNDSIDAPIAIASWTKSMECQQYSSDVIQGYVSLECNKAPEKLATCER